MAKSGLLNEVFHTSSSPALCSFEIFPSSPFARRSRGLYFDYIDDRQQAMNEWRQIRHRQIAFLVLTFPATWLLMLFFGNIGLALSYWGTLPLGILASILLGGVLSRPW